MILKGWLLNDLLFVCRATKPSRRFYFALLSDQLRDEVDDNRADKSAAAQQIDQRVAGSCQREGGLCEKIQCSFSREEVQKALFTSDFQLIIDIAFASDGKRDGFNPLFLTFRLHWPTQGNFAALRDDLDVLGVD